MEPVDFIGHFLAHTPDPYENSYHYFGAYSNRFRNKMWKSGAWKHPDDNYQEDFCSIEIKEKTPVKKSSSSWARLIRKIWLSDPELCSNCGSRMKIIAFLSTSQTDVIDKILDHLSMRTPPRSPPKVNHHAAFGDEYPPQTQDDSGFFTDPIWSYESYQ
jgi:hypothetical protein